VRSGELAKLGCDHVWDDHDARLLREVLDDGLRDDFAHEVLNALLEVIALEEVLLDGEDVDAGPGAQRPEGLAFEGVDDLRVLLAGVQEHQVD
jgi:hypothetical protein